MKFREQLKIVETLGLNICDLVVAYECKCVFGFKYTDEEFESLCEFAVYMYLKSDFSANAIATTINELICYGDYTIDELLEMNKHEFFEAVSADGSAL